MDIEKILTDMNREANLIKRNRRNAVASTGPKTPRGKERAAGNALTHGLRSSKNVIPGESEREWNRFKEAVADDLKASSPTERAITHHIASALWRLARGGRYEAEVVHRNTTGEDLEIAYEKHIDSYSGMVKMTLPRLEDVAKAQRALEDASEPLETYQATAEFFKSLPGLAPDTAVDKEHFKEYLKWMGHRGEELKAGMLEIKVYNAKNVMEYFTKCRLSVEKIHKHLEKRYQERLELVEALQEELEKRCSHYQAALESFAAITIIPRENELARLQTYEAHLYRNLHRSLESLKLLRELSSPPSSDITVAGKVANEPPKKLASIVKKGI